jgi:hypothetical protein
MGPPFPGLTQLIHQPVHQALALYEERGPKHFLSGHHSEKEYPVKALTEHSLFP